MNGVLTCYNKRCIIVSVNINRTYRFRIYPNKDQRKSLAKQFGACRFVYNHFLRTRIDYYAAHKDDQGKHGLTYFDTAAMLTQLKKQNEFSWLQEANAQSLQQTLRNLDVAYNNFFNKRAKFPHFKSKRARQAFHVPQGFGLRDGRLHLPKFSPIKIILHRPIEGAMKSVTVSMTPAGCYYASILCECDIPEPQYEGQTIGCDLGLKDFLVTSNGEHVAAPGFLRQSEKRLHRKQRHLSRCKRGSQGREKARLAVAREHERIANQRSDFLHKLSRRLVDENQAIGAESLNVKGMIANHCLAKSISDAGWAEFLRQLEYKGGWYGCHIWQVNRFFPSSKRCHDCGYILQDLRLSQRSWTCPECGVVHDRDENAARNILTFCTVGTTGTHTPGESPVADSRNPEAPAFRRG